MHGGRVLKAAIIGIAGSEVSAQEARLLRAAAPLGVILFARNIAEPGQLRTLTESLRGLLPDGGEIMVDQEGGRVARLRPPHWHAHPPAALIGALAARDLAAGCRAAWLQGALIGAQCASMGFTLIAAPVLDRAIAGAHDVIGDRAFGDDPALIARCGRAWAEGLLAAGVCPVGKHAPGHGGVSVDSHLALPELEDADAAAIAPFAANAWLPWMMTAHVRYKAVDMEHPGTVSARVISEVIRGRIGFGGVLVSDDLAMQALSGDAGSRTAACMSAGCDVALHCSGILAESEAVLAAAPRVSAQTASRLARARAMARSACVPLDLPALRDERAALLGWQA